MLLKKSKMEVVLRSMLIENLPSRSSLNPGKPCCPEVG